MEKPVIQAAEIMDINFFLPQRQALSANLCESTSIRQIIEGVHKYLAHQHRQGQTLGAALFHKVLFVVAQFIAPL
ncbi:MAG: hypothetical protein OXI43_02855 [Candidatus Poribacteria bacterium]|nr:hypothetical protein [Candidatus Poribacteria bacterium]